MRISLGFFCYPQPTRLSVVLVRFSAGIAGPAVALAYDQEGGVSGLQSMLTQRVMNGLGCTGGAVGRAALGAHERRAAGRLQGGVHL